MSRYLEKHALYPPLFPSTEGHPDIIVVIPSHNEPDILSTLSSLQNCLPPSGKVEVIIVVNQSDLAPKQIKLNNESTMNDIQKFINTSEPWFTVFSTNIEFTPKYAGVGMARKVGMDEAARRLKNDGIIICLDADCTVSSDYFQSIQQYFRENTKSIGAAIHYEHPLSGPLDSSHYEAIMQYELHLRYYVDMQRRIQLPYAVHTVGSSMAVRNSVYQAVGGMNRRKAGEDFYFIQKLVKHGPFTCCNSTTVYPSARSSDRVPFGTGKAIGDMIKENNLVFYSYPPGVFKVVEKFIRWVESYYFLKKDSMPQELNGWIADDEVRMVLNEIQDNTSDHLSYKIRFFKWYDGFRLMKMLHHLRDHGYPLQPVETCVKSVIPDLKEGSCRSLLEHYRKIDLLCS